LIPQCYTGAYFQLFMFVWTYSVVFSFNWLTFSTANEKKFLTTSIPYPGDGVFVSSSGAPPKNDLLDIAVAP